ncbi:hypothetical protein Ciccas_000905 [Cichlidogyrus casuarinus]|uniref:Protein HIRA n=1 Tax=Cichlidogyrus casuarinus TaxID=1844966 RepID=A0ABD2QLL7_9PLAT
MKILKPGWVSHGRLSKTDRADLPIYGLDLHPDGSRLATGGMSDNCGLIVLWNMEKIRNPNQKLSKDDSYKLSQIDGHQSCVNCVRWSPQGKWLASAGMDHVVMLWEKSAGSRSAATFGVKQKVPFKEYWRNVVVLRGHKGDIIDLDWNIDGSLLASASVDNHVMIWRKNIPQGDCTPGPLFTSIASLDKHTDFVKGVAWDPVGRFLASQSDDKTLRVWRVSDWTEEAKISQPFKNSKDQDQFMRLSWSPDGSCLAATHSLNNFFPTIKLIERKTFQPSLDLVGHKKHVLCTRYNPCIMSKNVNGHKSDALFLATGSKDRSLSIWNNLMRRPFVVIHDLFTKPVCDLSWSSSGLELVAASLDGSIAYISFTPAELGVPWLPKELAALHQKKYGSSLLANNNTNCSFVANKSVLLESAEAVRLKEAQAEMNAVSLLPTEGTKSDSSKILRKETGPAVQVESRAKDGRRRIMPKFLGSLASPIEEDELSNKTSSSLPNQETKSKSPFEDNSSASGQTIHNQAVEDTEVQAPKKRKLVLFEDDDVPVEPKRPATIGTKTAGQETTTSSSSPTAAVPHQQLTVLLPSKDFVDFASSSDQLDLAGGSVNFVCAGASSSESGMLGPILVSVTSDYSKKKFQLSGVQCHKCDWTVTSKYAFTSFAHNGGSWFAVGNSCGRIHFYRSNGQLIGTPLICDCSGVLALAISSSSAAVHIASLTRAGRLKVWQLSSQFSNSSSKLSLPGSCFGLLDYTLQSPTLLHDMDLLQIISGDNAKFRGLLFSEEGKHVIVQLQNGSVFAFSIESGAWLEIFCSRDPFKQALASAFAKIAPSGPLASLTNCKCNKQQTEHSLPSLSNLSKLTEFQRFMLCSFLESQTKLCIRFGSSAELKFWITRWARSLIECGKAKEIRELVLELLGPVNDCLGTHHNSEIKGISKVSLVKEILPLFALNLNLQRTYFELKDLATELS